MNESFIKYLAGLMDADGSFYFQFVKNKEGWWVYPRIVLCAATSTDKHGFVANLPIETGIGVTVKSEFRNGWQTRNDWVVCKWADINRLTPRLIKHQVIKARHWDWVLGILSECRGQTISDTDKERLAEAWRFSRFNSGPIKPKNHPSWAWTAGYLDGDGCFHAKYYPNRSHMRIRVTATAHANDRIALEMLHKAFGGHVRHVNDHLCRWQRGMGYSQSSFALKFLGKLVNHSRLKKHQIESLIHLHRQRLSDLTPTGEATV